MGSNAAILGPPKSGKTRSLDTLPSPRVIFSFDPHGYSALRQEFTLLMPGQYRGGNLTWEKPTRVIDYAAAQRQISEGVDRSARTYDSGLIYRAFVNDLNAAILTAEVASLAIDGLTGMSNVILEAVMSLNKRSKVNTQADYGDAIEKIAEIVGVCAANEKNFVLLTHIQLEKDELSGRIKELPLVYGRALPGRLLALFDSVFQAAFSGETFYWLTKPTPLMQTIGSRLHDNLPEKIAQDFAQLFNGNPLAPKPANKP